MIRQVDIIKAARGTPKTIRFDNGSQFTSRATLEWGADLGITLHFIDPGKPAQNAHVVSLNGRSRDDLLSATRSGTSLTRRLADEWRTDYNDVRPHSALGYLTPREFAGRHEHTQPSELSVA